MDLFECAINQGIGALELESSEIRVKFDDKNKSVKDLVAKASSCI